jgi:hypothetical protein
MTAAVEAAEGRPDPVDVAAVVLWVRVPRMVLRRFPSTWGVAGDGHFLVAVPPLATLAPVLVTVAAFVIGAGGVGYRDVFTESLVLVAAAVAVGVFSTQLGALAVAGFAAGDFFVANRSWSVPRTAFGQDHLWDSGTLGNLLRVRLPLVITYLILGLAVVIIPRTARAVISLSLRWRRMPAALAWPIGSGVYVLFVWIGIRTWVAAAPVLVRPRFTWAPGGAMPVLAAIQPLQTRGSVVVAVAVAAALVRQLVIVGTLVPGPFRTRVRAAEDDGPVTPPGPVHVPGSGEQWAIDIAVAGLGTLVLGGILEEPRLWVLTFAVLLAVRLGRSGRLAPSVLNRWRRLVAKVPFAVRLVLLWLGALVVTDALARGTINSYGTMAYVVLAGTVAAFVIFPGAPPPDPDDGPEPATPAEAPA